MADQGRHDPGRQAARGGMRLLRMVGGPEVVGPVTQRNIGVWLGLGLIVVIVGLDLVGGGNAELLGLLVSPPILARPMSTTSRVEPSPGAHTVRSEPVGTSFRCRWTSCPSGEK